jgi:hypothetical protein
MTTIYRKTPKGQTEVETRANRLTPRLRAALILVDGRRSEDELTKLVSNDAAQLLRSLLDDGYVERAEAAAAPPRPQPAPAPRQAAPEAPPSAPGLLSMPPSVIAATKRDAVRVLTEQIGPMAEALSLKIERAGSAAELQGLLEIGCQVLGNTRGRAAAETFAQRFLAPAAQPVA